jgi:hypothetical protein
MPLGIFSHLSHFSPLLTVSPLKTLQTLQSLGGENPPEKAMRYAVGILLFGVDSSSWIQVR